MPQQAHAASKSRKTFPNRNRYGRRQNSYCGPRSQTPGGFDGVPEVTLWPMDFQVHVTVSPGWMETVNGSKVRAPPGATVTLKVVASPTRWSAKSETAIIVAQRIRRFAFRHLVIAAHLFWFRLIVFGFIGCCPRCILVTLFKTAGSHRQRSFLSVQRCTAGKPARGYGRKIVRDEADRDALSSGRASRPPCLAHIVITSSQRDVEGER